MGVSVDRKKDERTRGGLPRGTANGEPYFIPGLSPEIPRAGNLPRGTANGEPYVIPPREGSSKQFNPGESVAALNDMLGGKSAPPVHSTDREEPVVVAVADKQPVSGQESPTDLTNMSPADWKDLQHVQDVMSQMPGTNARNFAFRAPGELMADPEFQRWDGMSDEERFVRGAMMDQIRSQTLQQRQARLHGLTPHQFSGFGGANDGTSAAFYRAVPRTQANPQVVRQALEGAGDRPIQMQQAINQANQFQFASSPQGMAMTMINRGVPPEEAMDAAARIIQQFGGGGRGMAPQAMGPMTPPSMAEQRAVFTNMQRNLASSPTIAEFLGQRKPEEFDVNDLYDAYQKWIDGKLNDTDLRLLSQFIRARDSAGSPVEVPRSLLWDTEMKSGIRAWLESLRNGQIDRPTLEQSYQTGAANSFQNNKNRWLDIFAGSTGIPVDGE